MAASLPLLITRLYQASLQAESGVLWSITKPIKSLTTDQLGPTLVKREVRPP
jgi:hypothetical protein